MTDGWTVLAYHAVGPPPPGGDPHGLCVPTDAFTRQMEHLVHHRTVVPLAELVAGARSSRPLVAVTFDDGYTSVLEEAAPVLAALGLPGTVFVPTAHLGGCNAWDGAAGAGLRIMTADELRAVERLGVDVESHGHAHLDLAAATEDRARTDLATSMDRLERVLGRRPRFVAYPFRTASPGARAAAAGLGLAAAFTIDLPHDGRFGWGRVSVGPHDSRAVFAAKTSGRYLRLRHQPLLDCGYRGLRRLRPRV